MQASMYEASSGLISLCLPALKNAAHCLLQNGLKTGLSGFSCLGYGLDGDVGLHVRSELRVDFVGKSENFTEERVCSVREAILVRSTKRSICREIARVQAPFDVRREFRLNGVLGC